MTSRDRSGCQACPPTEQLIAAGLLAGADGWYVNVRFTSPPLNARVSLNLDGVALPIDLEQAGSVWHLAGASGASGMVTGVAQRNDQVVFTLPASLRVAGLVVSTGSGDRMPASGSLAPQFPASAHFNATDIVLLAIFGVTAWFGYKRGILAEIGNLLAVVVSIGVAALVYRPVAAWLGDLMHSPRVGAALASGALVLGVGLASLAVMPTVLRSLRGAAADMDALVNHGLGSVAASLRQAMVLAMLVTIGLDAAVFRWASGSISSSVIGGTLLHAWHSLFAAH